MIQRHLYEWAVSKVHLVLFGYCTLEDDSKRMMIPKVTGNLITFRHSGKTPGLYFYIKKKGART
jgi:hypothetical protein